MSATIITAPRTTSIRSLLGAGVVATALASAATPAVAWGTNTLHRPSRCEAQNFRTAAVRSTIWRRPSSWMTQTLAS